MNAESDVNQTFDDERRGEVEEHPSTPGTFVLTCILLAAFAVYYFANWKALSDVWYVR